MECNVVVSITGPDLILLYNKSHCWDFQKKPLVFGSQHAGALSKQLHGSSVG